MQKKKKDVKKRKKKVETKNKTVKKKVRTSRINIHMRIAALLAAIAVVLISYMALGKMFALFVAVLMAIIVGVWFLLTQKRKKRRKILNILLIVFLILGILGLIGFSLLRS